MKRQMWIAIVIALAFTVSAIAHGDKGQKSCCADKNKSEASVQGTSTPATIVQVGNKTVSMDAKHCDMKSAANCTAADMKDCKDASACPYTKGTKASLKGMNKSKIMKTAKLGKAKDAAPATSGGSN